MDLGCSWFVVWWFGVWLAGFVGLRGGGSLVVRFAGWWLHCFGWFWVLRISWLGFVLVLGFDHL